jgi:hypothetical protein
VVSLVRGLREGKSIADLLVEQPGVTVQHLNKLGILRALVNNPSLELPRLERPDVHDVCVCAYMTAAVADPRLRSSLARIPVAR